MSNSVPNEPPTARGEVGQPHIAPRSSHPCRHPVPRWRGRPTVVVMCVRCLWWGRSHSRSVEVGQCDWPSQSGPIVEGS